MYTRQSKEFLNELKLAKGRNCLIFAIAANSEEFVEQVESCDLHVNEIHLNRNINLLEVLSDWEKTSENTVYFVEGVRSQFPRVLGYLNLHRDIFYEIKRPVVIFGSEYDITEITRYAPDLWRFRSRTYDFTENIEMFGEFLPSSSEQSVAAEEHLYYDLPIFETEDEDEIKERIKADNYLLEIVKEDHKRAELYMSLAISHLKLHDFDGGKEYFDKTSKVRRKLNDDKGISIDYKRFGDFYISEREYDKAMEYYGEAIRADPYHAAAHHNLGVLLNNLKRYDEAEEAFRRSIKIGVQLGDERGVAMALNSLGGVLQRQGHFDEAEKAFRDIIEIDEKLGNKRGVAMALNSLGGVLQRQGRFEAAEDTFRRSIEIGVQLDDKRGLAMALNSLGGVLQRQGHFDEAEKAFRDIIELDEKLGNKRGMAMTLSSLGGVLQDQGKFDEAEKTLQRSIEIGVQLGDERHLAMALNSLGGVLQRQGKFEEAKEAWGAAIRADPDDAEVHANLGALLLETERPEEAKNEFNIAKELFKNQGRAEHVKKVEELLANT
jgi:tetratricopeptide (TPR) repeat protein